jgi:hypothetical protein
MAKRHPQEVDYDMEQEATKPCRIMEGYEGAGRTGHYFGNMMINGGHWAIVLFDDEDDPCFFKFSCLEARTWGPIS